MPKIAAIILCGGQGRRMGGPKADLRFGEETLLQRAVRLIGAETFPVIVAAAPTQRIPHLSQPAIVVHDPEAGCGPLRALASAFRALPPETEYVYLSAVDSPFFSSRWLRLLVENREGVDVVTAADSPHPQPFAALYRVEPTRLALNQLTARNEERLTRLPVMLSRREIPAQELTAVDPEGLIRTNLNRPEDLRRAWEILVQQG